MRSSVDLPQPGRADEDDELAVVDLEVDAVDDRRRAVGLADAPQLQGCHRWMTLVSVAVRRTYFTPADAMPVVMWRCRKANTSVTGSSVITVMASR